MSLGIEPDLSQACYIIGCSEKLKKKKMKVSEPDGFEVFHYS